MELCHGMLRRLGEALRVWVDVWIKIIVVKEDGRWIFGFIHGVFGVFEIKIQVWRWIPHSERKHLGVIHIFISFNQHRS